MRASAVTLASLALRATAQSTTTAQSTSAALSPTISQGTAAPNAASTQTSITVILGSISSTSNGATITQKVTSGFAASVMRADACSTVLALDCTDAAGCSSTGLMDTVTIGPNVWNIEIATDVLGASATLNQNCVLYGPLNSATQAACTQTLEVQSGARSVTRTGRTTLAGDRLNYQAVPVTAGANLLAAVTGSCTSTPAPLFPTNVPGTGLTSSTSTSVNGGMPAAAAAATGLREVYKVVVPVGAALLALA